MLKALLEDEEGMAAVSSTLPEGTSNRRRGRPMPLAKIAQVSGRRAQSINWDNGGPRSAARRNNRRQRPGQFVTVEQLLVADATTAAGRLAAATG
jgi:hypothetical protein